MKKRYYSPIVKVGNRLFRLRRWFYGIPIFVLLLNSANLYYPFGSHFYDEFFEVSGLAIALMGAFLRFWASGSSCRTVIRKGKTMQFHYQTTGVFSLVRTPFFLGDTLILMGLSVPLAHPILITLSMVTFFLLYFPVYFAREEILLNRFGDSYRRYRQKASLIIPSLNHWKPNKRRFRWGVALRKEANILTLLCMLYFCIEQFRDLQIEGYLDGHPFWISLVFVFFVFFLTARILEGFLEDLPDVPYWMDYD